MYEAAVDEVGDTHTVIAGTGTYDTIHSVHLTERAHAIGVHGFLVVTPYYNRPPQRGIIAHVETIASATDRPVVFYDIPSRVVTDAEPATISALAAIQNVTAVKQAKPSLDAARHVVAEGLDLYAGDDDLIYPFLEVGGVGGICVHTHVVGPQVKEMVSLFRAGDADGARAIDDGAPARDRPPPRADEPDRDQDGAQHARPRRGRLPVAARRRDARGRGGRSRLPRAARPAPGRCRLTATRSHGTVPLVSPVDCGTMTNLREKARQ